MDPTTERAAKVRMSDRIINFLQKSRKPLLISVIVIVIAIVAAGVVLTVLENARNKSIVAVETLALQYDEIRVGTDEAKKETDTLSLIKDLEAYSSSNKSYAGGRSLSILAGIRADRKEWAEAETAWLAAAKTMLQQPQKIVAILLGLLNSIIKLSQSMGRRFL